MRRCLVWVAIAGGLAAGAGCVPAGYVKDPGPWVRTADWSQAERVRVEIGDRALEPQVLTLEESRPYVIEVANRASGPRRLSAPGFFKAVAARTVRVPEVAAVSALRYTGIEIEPGRSVDIELVAVRPGTYRVLTTIPGIPGAELVGAFRIVKKE